MVWPHVYGKPRSLLSGDGREFPNDTTRAVYERWSIVHQPRGGTSYHRFSNSPMTRLAARFAEDWPEYLPAAASTYNASTSDAT